MTDRLSHWNTEEIVSLLSPVCTEIKISGQGGDCDTENLRCWSGIDGPIYIYGFKDDLSDIDTPSDADIDRIAVTDGLDSWGGWNPTGDNDGAGVLFVRIANRLVRAGHRVVRTLDDYQ